MNSGGLGQLKEDSHEQKDQIRSWHQEPQNSSLSQTP